MHDKHRLFSVPVVCRELAWPFAHAVLAALVDGRHSGSRPDLLALAYAIVEESLEEVRVSVVVLPLPVPLPRPLLLCPFESVVGYGRGVGVGVALVGLSSSSLTICLLAVAVALCLCQIRTAFVQPFLGTRPALHDGHCDHLLAQFTAELGAAEVIASLDALTADIAYFEGLASAGSAPLAV